MPSNHLILCCPLLLPPSIFPSIKVFSNESVLMGFSFNEQEFFNFIAAVTICSDFGELDYKESRVPKNWCFWIVVLEKTLESSLDCKEIQPVHPKGNQPWIFTGKTDAEAETPILWPHDAKNWLIWKDPDVGKDWGQEEKGMTEDKMVGWHHRLNGHEFE